MARLGPPGLDQLASRLADLRELSRAFSLCVNSLFRKETDDDRE
jgi:hypothetical protein